VAYLALSQALVATTLVLANRVEGGVVAYHLAFTVFLLPHAVLAHPTITAVYPRLAAEAAARRWKAFAETLRRSAAVVVLLVAPAVAVLVALGRPALSLLRLGSLDAAGAALVADVLAAYALGLVGYAGFHLLTRASYATGDTRSPAIVNLGVAAGGSALMLALFAVADGGDRVVALGLAHSVAMVAGAATLLAVVGRRAGEACVPAGSLLRGLGAGVAAGVAARLVADRLPAGGRPAATLALALGGAAAGAVYLAVQAWLRAPELKRWRAGGMRGALEPAPGGGR
jgi:putative peptidoglycan lipid II flippase